MKVQFQQWVGDLKISRYQDNGRTAIRITSEEIGPIAMASVNLCNISDEKFKELADKYGQPVSKMVFIKDYSENEGMLDALVSQGIVEDTGFRAATGFVTVPLCVLREVS